MAMTVAISLIKDPRLAGEIVQDALMAAWKIVPYFKDRSSFRAALYRLVMKEACIKLKGNRHGKGSWDRNMDENILIENVFLSLKRSEQITFIREALKKIPPHEPLMLRLFNLQERGNTTIGSLNPGTAHSYPKKRAGNLAMPASL